MQKELALAIFWFTAMLILVGCVQQSPDDDTTRSPPTLATPVSPTPTLTPTAQPTPQPSTLPSEEPTPAPTTELEVSQEIYHLFSEDTVAAIDATITFGEEFVVDIYSGETTLIELRDYASTHLDGEDDLVTVTADGQAAMHLPAWYIAAAFENLEHSDSLVTMYDWALDFTGNPSYEFLNHLSKFLPEGQDGYLSLEGLAPPANDLTKSAILAKTPSPSTTITPMGFGRYLIDHMCLRECNTFLVETRGDDDYADDLVGLISTADTIYFENPDLLANWDSEYVETNLQAQSDRSIYYEQLSTLRVKLGQKETEIQGVQDAIDAITQ